MRQTSAAISTKSRNRPRRASYKLSYASPEQPAAIVLKFEDHRRPVYDIIDRAAREGNVSRQQVIFNAIAAMFNQDKKE